MLHFNPLEMSVPEIHRLLVGGVGPRPIALVSTISTDGIPNLAPYSFFNTFGANPPMIAFSPARRGSNGTFKDTYNNLLATGECVVQAVTYNIVSQVSIASGEYSSDVNEFIKSGLTPIDSEVVKPKRVKESPFQMECILKQMINLGDKNASGNLALCEVVRFHVAEDIIVDGTIEPEKIDLVARMSAHYYCRASGDAIFKLEQPNAKIGIGFDQLPEKIRNSKFFTGYELGRLASIQKIPDDNELENFIKKILENTPENFENEENSFNDYLSTNDLSKMINFALNSDELKNDYILKTVRVAIELDQIETAWLLLMIKMKSE
jgi:flavin reductase (DIM6/NTAB) family NADH-FMN oxidoreductase RutF